jgi:hypothetical protein
LKFWWGGLGGKLSLDVASTKQANREAQKNRHSGGFFGGAGQTRAPASKPSGSSSLPYVAATLKKTTLTGRNASGQAEGLGMMLSDH